MPQPPDPGAIQVHNEWDPLESIIVGTARGARCPRYDRSFHATFYHDLPRAQVPTGPFPERVLTEAEEDLDALAALLVRAGVTVHRPRPTDCAASFSTPDWTSDGLYHYCPRDLLLAVGDTVIECPLPMRARFLEARAYRHLMLDAIRAGSRWISAPPPVLADSLYDLEDPARPGLLEDEPAFDAANVLRMGRDLLYLRSNTGNALGAQWLAATLGPGYRVHLCRDLYPHIHLDTTLVLLRPGLVLANPERVTADNLPAPLKGWDLIYSPEMVDIGHCAGHARPCASIWIGMNFLMLDPHTALVEERQVPLMRLLARYGIDPVPIRLRHARTLGGGAHCVTLDTRRRGTLESYVD
jgi:N-dimethylarginine dimethylaminohydrolase